MYSSEIAPDMTLIKFGEIKRNINMCNNDTSTSIYQEGYDHAYTFDLPYKDFVANINAISVKTDENLGIDESSWTHCGYGEAVSEICGVGVYGCWKVRNLCIHASPQALQT